MPVQINYHNKNSRNATTNPVYFVDEKFNIDHLRKYISNNEFSYISELIKSRDLNSNIHTFEIDSKKKIFLVSIKNDIEILDVENLGANFFGILGLNKKKNYTIYSNTVISKIKNFLQYFLHGLKLKSYQFDIYKSKKNKDII